MSVRSYLTNRRVLISLTALAVGGATALGAATTSVATPPPAHRASHQHIGASSAAAPMKPAEEFKRAAAWLTANNGHQVPYSQSKTWKDGYRQDCSGYVSMALNLGAPGPNTVGLTDDRFTKPMKVADLKPGDLLIDADGDNNTRHVVIFEKWTDSSHRGYMAYEQRGGHGTDHRVLNYGLDQGSEFKPYRPVNLTN